MSDRRDFNLMGIMYAVEKGLHKMQSPYRCLRCGRVHDAAKVEVTARYADCSVWRCPNCHAEIDDRPRGWGGSAEPVRRGRDREER